MNDRLKYRVFDKVANKYIDLKDFRKGEIEFNFDPDTQTIWIEYDKSRYVVEQCTGLKDKNGKLIYEGDIVKITKTTWLKKSYSLVYLVCYDTIQWQLGLFKYQRAKAQENRRPDRKIPLKRIVSFDDYTPKRMFAECEVIGNIYTNPELIGGAEC